MKDIVQDLVPKDQSKGADINMMLEQLQTLNKIAVLKEDDFVIRSIMRGHTRTKILKELQTKYPKETFYIKDIDDFIIFYQDVLYSEKANLEKAYVRRAIQSQAGLSNKLTDLIIYTEQLARKYDEEKDNSATIAAIRTTSDMLMKIGKLQGHFQEKPDVNINMQMDKVVTNVTDGNSSFKDKIMKVMDADIVNDGTRKKNI